MHRDAEIERDDDRPDSSGTPYDLIAAQFSAARDHLRPEEAGYLSLLLDPLPAGSTILDLGCGSGHPIAAHIVSRGHRVVGVDASSRMLELARAALPEQRWIHQRMELLELDESFPGVVCWDALFHLPRRRFPPVIEKIHRWLEPGGRVMLSSGGLVDEDGRGFTDTMFGQEFYYDSLPPGVLTTLLEYTGFDIVLAEMCEQPDGARNRGKWATIAERRT